MNNLKIFFKEMILHPSVLQRAVLIFGSLFFFMISVIDLGGFIGAITALITIAFLYLAASKKRIPKNKLPNLNSKDLDL